MKKSLFSFLGQFSFIKGIIIILISSQLLISCSGEDGKMKLKSTKTNNTLILKIENFPDFYLDFTDVTQPFTDTREYSIEEINGEIFDYIKEKCKSEKECKIFVSYNKTDKYGNKIKTKFILLGVIDVQELIKYKDSSLWVASTCGIIYVKYGICNYW
jgi:hypothetical protein